MHRLLFDLSCLSAVLHLVYITYTITATGRLFKFTLTRTPLTFAKIVIYIHTTHAHTQTIIYTYRRFSKQHVLKPSPRARFAEGLLGGAPETSQAHCQLLVTLAQPLAASTSQCCSSDNSNKTEDVMYHGCATGKFNWMERVQFLVPLK